MRRLPAAVFPTASGGRRTTTPPGLLMQASQKAKTGVTWRRGGPEDAHTPAAPARYKRVLVRRARAFGSPRRMMHTTSTSVGCGPLWVRVRDDSRGPTAAPGRDQMKPTGRAMRDTRRGHHGTIRGHDAARDAGRSTRGALTGCDGWHERAPERGRDGGIQARNDDSWQRHVGIFSQRTLVPSSPQQSPAQ